jgi:isocitrate dehydrogenase
MGLKHSNERATILADTLNDAIEKLLDNNKSPSRKVGELDNRGSFFSGPVLGSGSGRADG